MSGGSSSAWRRHAERGAILGELGVSVFHLHVHTKGLDGLLDVLE